MQVKLPVRTYEPLQLTEEEFRANVEADRRAAASVSAREDGRVSDARLTAIDRIYAEAIRAARGGPEGGPGAAC